MVGKEKKKTGIQKRNNKQLINFKLFVHYPLFTRPNMLSLTTKSAQMWITNLQLTAYKWQDRRPKTQQKQDQISYKKL